MSRIARLAAAGFGAVALCASIAAADPDTPTRTRVTIRGTGNAVAIERTQAPGRRLSQEGRLPPGPLGDAIAMKFGGADDASVIAFLRKRQGDLAPVIEAGDVRLLRKAGAGKALTNFLATVSAVDLGPIGEGHETVTVVAPLPPPEEGMSYGYGADAYGYAAPYPVFLPRIAHRHFPHPRHMSLHPPHARLGPTFAMRAAVGRFPFSQ